MRAPCYESQTTVSFLYALLLQQATVLPQVKAESKKVWKFIIEREIEAPARFQAIQTHRAAMAILRQQVFAQMALSLPDQAIPLGSMSVITCAGMFCNGIHQLLPCNVVEGSWMMGDSQNLGVARCLAHLIVSSLVRTRRFSWSSCTAVGWWMK